MSLEQNIFVAVDSIVIANNQKVLLIKRKNEPFMGSWAFPGGFLEEDEDLQEGAVRELFEETGLKIDSSQLTQIGAFGKPHRDPRFRTVSIVYSAHLQKEQEVKGEDDAAEARWFDMDDLPELAFDHSEILSKIR